MAKKGTEKRSGSKETNQKHQANTKRQTRPNNI